MRFHQRLFPMGNYTIQHGFPHKFPIQVTGRLNSMIMDGRRMKICLRWSQEQFYTIDWSLYTRQLASASPWRSWESYDGPIWRYQHAVLYTTNLYAKELFLPTLTLDLSYVAITKRAYGQYAQDLLCCGANHVDELDSLDKSPLNWLISIISPLLNKTPSLALV